MKEMNATERERMMEREPLYINGQGRPSLRGNIKAKSQNEKKAHVSRMGRTACRGNCSAD